MNGEEKEPLEKTEEKNDSLLQQEYESNSLDDISTTEVNDDELEYERKRKKRIKGWVKEIIFYVALIVVCVFIIPQYVIQRTVVEGSSMDYTLKDQDNLFVEKISYRFHEPERFDIVVIDPKKQLPSEKDYYIKRIIGLPNETIQIKDGIIYINGEKIEDKYCLSDMSNSGVASEPIKLKENEYFVLGDNRFVSTDSRSLGPFTRDQIKGKAVLRIWPLDTFGTVQ